MASDEPNFEANTADIIAIYMKSPQHGAVFYLMEDGDSGIGLPRSNTSVVTWANERHGFEYYRNGTLSLYAGGK